MSYTPGPGSRVPIPRSRARLERRRAAQRRGFAAFLGVLAIVIAALAWASAGGDEERAGGTRGSGASTGASGGTTGSGATGGTGTTGSGSEIVPGQTPIEHVVFIVKENRTFNNYFATYPGAEGAPEGGTIRCTEDGCEDGPVVQLTRGSDVYEHDLTHCFRCGLVAINDGKMNGFNWMNGVIPTTAEKAPLYGHDMSGYTYLEREDIPNYWASRDPFGLAATS